MNTFIKTEEKCEHSPGNAIVFNDLPYMSMLSYLLNCNFQDINRLSIYSASAVDVFKCSFEVFNARK